MNLRTASLLAITPLLLAKAAFAQRTDLYLLIGQSNMAGRGPVEARDREPIPGVFALTEANTWVPAVDPLHWDKPGIAGVGPGRGFAKRMREAEPTVDIGLIPAAFGGTSLEQWAVGGKLYTDAVERTRTALRLAGPGAKLKGMLWHQGEAECGKEALANTYIERWSVIVAALKKDLNAPDVPVIVGQLGTFLEAAKSPFAGVVNAQLKAIPSRIPNTAFVSSEGLKDKGDMVHFDSEGARELGRRYAAGLLGLTSAKGHDFFYAGK